MKMQNKNQQGQALIIVLFISAVVVLIVAQVTTLNLSNLGLANNYYDGSLLLDKAEGYLENAALRYLRDPNYTGENLQDEGVVCIVEINDIGLDKDLTCQCEKNGKSRKVGLTISFDQGVFNFSKIEERTE